MEPSARLLVNRRVLGRRQAAGIIGAVTVVVAERARLERQAETLLPGAGVRAIGIRIRVVARGRIQKPEESRVRLRALVLLPGLRRGALRVRVDLATLRVELRYYPARVGGDPAVLVLVGVLARVLDARQVLRVRLTELWLVVLIRAAVLPAGVGDRDPERFARTLGRDESRSVESGFRSGTTAIVSRQIFAVVALRLLEARSTASRGPRDWRNFRRRVPFPGSARRVPLEGEVHLRYRGGLGTRGSPHGEVHTGVVANVEVHADVVGPRGASAAGSLRPYLAVPDRHGGHVLVVLGHGEPEPQGQADTDRRRLGVVGRIVNRPERGLASPSVPPSALTAQIPGTRPLLINRTQLMRNDRVGPLIAPPRIRVYVIPVVIRARVGITPSVGATLLRRARTSVVRTVDMILRRYPVLVSRIVDVDRASRGIGTALVGRNGIPLRGLVRARTHGVTLVRVRIAAGQRVIGRGVVTVLPAGVGRPLVIGDRVAGIVRIAGVAGVARVHVRVIGHVQAERLPRLLDVVGEHGFGTVRHAVVLVDYVHRRHEATPVAALVNASGVAPTRLRVQVIDPVGQGAAARLVVGRADSSRGISIILGETARRCVRTNVRLDIIGGHLRAKHGDVAVLVFRRVSSHLCRVREALAVNRIKKFVPDARVFVRVTWVGKGTFVRFVRGLVGRGVIRHGIIAPPTVGMRPEGNGSRREVCVLLIARQVSLCSTGVICLTIFLCGYNKQHNPFRRKLNPFTHRA